MEPRDLVKVWDAPDNSRLTPKQLSIRLPLLVSARISALCDIYPRKTKTEIIGDLLSTALDQLEGTLPSACGQAAGERDGETIYEDIGLRGRFNVLTEKYLRELEKEAGITEPMPFSQRVTS